MSGLIVGTRLCPLLHGLRLSPGTVPRALSARGGGGRDAALTGTGHTCLAVQRRHQWVGAEEFSSEAEALEWINQGSILEGVQRQLEKKRNFIKPYMERKKRYDRWVRRRSIDKINNLLSVVNHKKAGSQVSNERVEEVFKRARKRPSDVTST